MQYHSSLRLRNYIHHPAIKQSKQSKKHTPQRNHHFAFQGLTNIETEDGTYFQKSIRLVRGRFGQTIDLLTFLFFRAMLSCQFFLRVQQIGICLREAYFENILWQVGHCTCFISCAFLKQLSSSLSLTWQDSFIMQFLVIAWRADGFMAGRVQSYFYLKFISVLDFLFLYYPTSTSTVLGYFTVQRSVCFSNKNNGTLAWQRSHIFYSLLKIMLFCCEGDLTDGSLAAFLGEMIIGFSGVHNLR